MVIYTLDPRLTHTCLEDGILFPASPCFPTRAPRNHLSTLCCDKFGVWLFFRFHIPVTPGHIGLLSLSVWLMSLSVISSGSSILLQMAGFPPFPVPDEYSVCAHACVHARVCVHVCVTFSRPTHLLKDTWAPPYLGCREHCNAAVNMGAKALL